jgi:hypothetical protein
MVDRDGSPMTEQALAGAVMARAGSFLAVGDSLRLELMRERSSNCEDWMPLEAPRQAIAKRQPLDVLKYMVGGKEENLLIADPAAQMAAALTTLALGQGEQLHDHIHELHRDVRYWSTRALVAESRASRAESDLRWYRQTEPAANEGGGDQVKDPAWKALLTTIDGLREPLREIVSAGAAIARVKLGAPPASPPQVAEKQPETPDSEPAEKEQPDESGIPYDAIPEKVNLLADALVTLLLARPDLIGGLVPKLLPVLNAGGDAVVLGLRAWLAARNAVDVGPGAPP